ncbi:MAG: hypothetical protein ACLP3K_12090 [Candidatus Acidiferrales bacterium]
MPVDKKVDLFKPQAPSIPGVPAASEKPEKAAQPPPQMRAASGAQPQATPDRRAKMIGVAAGIGVVLLAGLIFLPGHHSPAQTNSNPSPEAASPDAANSEPAEKMMVGPGPVATAAELAKPWSEKEFLFRGPFSAEPVPAMVVRLPGGALWGFSLREPFGECELKYVTDLQELAADYGFRAAHPMVVNPCTHAVYDLMQYGGGAPDGGLVRGEIVQGAGVRPPMAIEMQTTGKDIIAVRSE